VLARGWAPTHGELRRMDGTVIKRAQLPPPEALGGPMVVALRPALHGGLLEALGEQAVTVSAEAVGFSQSGERVVLRLADGRTEEGDLLVGADGIWSAVRRALHPHEGPPRSCGIVAVRGAVHGTTEHLGGLSGIYYLGPGVESFLVRASDTGVYWALSLAAAIVPPDMRAPEAILEHMCPRMDHTFRAVTEGTQDLRCDELVDRDPIPSWGTGRITLLGDAAHPVLPHTGQGAAQAIVDAVALAAALGQDDSVERALRGYEGDRQQKTAALVHQGRRTARVMRSTSPALGAIREVAIRLAPVKTIVKLIATINRRAGTDVTA
jgi:2-polyprenyl-6-methoxyphenol hydroxylase-like FAD-dependent oxidoreductase